MLHSGLFQTVEFPSNSESGRYPFNAWTSLCFLPTAIALLEYENYIFGISAAALAIVSFLWWWTQNIWVRPIDLWLVTFLFLFLPCVEAKLSNQTQAWLAVTIFVVILANETFCAKANFAVILAAIAYCLFALAKYHIFLFCVVAGALIAKIAVPGYGTGIFHIVTAGALLYAAVSLGNGSKL